MGKRVTVGIIYKNDENWIGGTYYIQNLIAALCQLPEDLMPALTVFCSTKKEADEIRQIGYKYLSVQQLKFVKEELPISKKVINKIASIFTGYDVFPQITVLNSNAADFIFPSPIGLKTRADQKKIYWIPDFQEQFLPQFFSTAEIHNRNQSHKFIAGTKDQVVFSSLDAHNTFVKLFPASAVRKHILKFAVTHAPAYKSLNANSLTDKYNIDKQYFFAPNQFWKHKNQIVVLEAINILKEKGITNFLVAFSGKEHDYRNLNYVDELREYVKRNKLEPYIRFLGFIDRNEQLKLMSKAIAIIQPSLFEGWSTVVEDAKAMNQWVIASALPVHKEQLLENAFFFNPSDANELAVLIEKGIKSGFMKKGSDYKEQIINFAKDFVEIVK